MVRNLAERFAAAWRHSGCSGKGDWRWHPMAERLLGCAGRLVDCQHGVHCGALLTGFLHDTVLDRYRARISLLGTLMSGASCFATPHAAQASVGAEKRTGESGSSDGKAGKAETSVQPAEPWEERENSVGSIC